MPPRRPDEAEQQAEQFMSSLGAQVGEHDDGSQDGMYDYNVIWPDGTVDALEATAATMPAQEKLEAELLKAGWALPAKGAQRRWHIHVPSDARLKALRARLDGHLASVEAEGRERFYPRDSAWSPAVEALLNDLGRLSGVSQDLSKGAGIFLLPAPTSGFAGGELVSEAVLHEATKNADKLKRSGKNKRHLFVWIRLPSQSYFALIEGTPPSAPPRLPAAITTAWAAAQDVRDGHVVVWRAERERPWTVHSP